MDKQEIYNLLENRRLWHKVLPIRPYTTWRRWPVSYTHLWFFILQVRAIAFMLYAFKG